jgi:hypothetical protein
MPQQTPQTLMSSVSSFRFAYLYPTCSETKILTLFPSFHSPPNHDSAYTVQFSFHILIFYILFRKSELVSTGSCFSLSLYVVLLIDSWSTTVSVRKIFFSVEYMCILTLLLGRIGRIVLRNALLMENLQVVAINEYVSFIFINAFSDTFHIVRSSTSNIW